MNEKLDMLKDSLSLCDVQSRSFLMLYGSDSLGTLVNIYTYECPLYMFSGVVLCIVSLIIYNSFTSWLLFNSGPALHCNESVKFLDLWDS